MIVEWCRLVLHTPGDFFGIFFTCLIFFDCTNLLDRSILFWIFFVIGRLSRRQ